tara:strand:- start:2257 stop:3051 length:795 start_codon:yes stop_codon:yes gene_type:complete
MTAIKQHSMPSANTLNGLKVLITQTHPNHLPLTEAITTQGGQFLAKPCIEITPIPLSNMKKSGIQAASAWVFLSSHAARAVANTIRPYYEGQTIIAIGPKTQATLSEYNLTATIPTSYTSKGIAELPTFDNHTEKVIIFCRKNTTSTLKKQLIFRQHEAQNCPCYRHHFATKETFQLSCNDIQQIDAITVHSHNSLIHLQQAITQYQYHDLLSKPLFVVTEKMAETAKKIGFHTILPCQSPTTSAIVTKLTQWHMRRKKTTQTI